MCVLEAEDAAERQHGFLVRGKAGSKTVEWVFQAHDPASKQAWLAALRQALMVESKESTKSNRAEAAETLAFLAEEQQMRLASQKRRQSRLDKLDSSISLKQQGK